jgi:hypothetical protein
MFLESFFDELEKLGAKFNPKPTVAHKAPIGPAEPTANAYKRGFQEAGRRVHSNMQKGRGTPKQPWYKSPAAMIGGGLAGGYALSRLTNRDE